MTLFRKSLFSLLALLVFLPLSAETANPKTLVVYFSQTGTTERMARLIQNATGADIFCIEPKEPYTRNGSAMNDIDKITKEEIEKKYPSSAKGDCAEKNEIPAPQHEPIIRTNFIS